MTGNKDTHTAIELNPVFKPLNPSEGLKESILDIERKAALKKESKGLFTVKSANKWLEHASKRPVPKQLFGKLWYEGELSILFADTNLGKSILAVQIGDAISRGKAILGFQREAEAQKVLYFDFELSDKQFESRYSADFKEHYAFSAEFYRVEINSSAEVPNQKSFEEYLNESLEKSIVETGARILIIDNLTYLKNETEKARNALPLMKYLKELKSKYDLSILALAHTPKRDLSKAITKNDLQGSKMLINFCDSAFAIGESHSDVQLRYLKQIKARNTEILYDTDHVVLCQINKPYNFLRFDFVSFGIEDQHLKQLSEKDKESRMQEAMELKQDGLSNVEIARRFNVSEGAVRKWIKKAQHID